MFSSTLPWFVFLCLYKSLDRNLKRPSSPLKKDKVVNEICALFPKNVFNSSKYCSWPSISRRGLGLADLRRNYVVVAAVTSDCEHTVRRYQGANSVCVCVCSAAGPPGLGPAAAASRAGPQRGHPAQVGSAGGGEEEVSDAAKGRRKPRRKLPSAAAVFHEGSGSCGQKVCKVGTSKIYG